MKKVTVILALVVLAGGTFVSTWAYQRYFKKTDVPPITFKTVRGDIKERLQVRGDVAAEREYDLSFDTFGTVAEVAVEEGQMVQAGQLLMRLETTDFTIQLKRLSAQRLQTQAALKTAQAQLAEAMAARDASSARLDELKRGSALETLQVQQTKVEASRIALTNTNKAVIDAVGASLTTSDDAIRNVADQTFTNPRTDPKLGFIVTDDGLKYSVEARRRAMEPMFTEWQKAIATVTVEELSAVTAQSQTNLDAVKSLLDELALLLNGAIPTGTVTLADITAWRTAVATARASVDASIKVLTSAETQRQVAVSALSVALDEQKVLLAGTSVEEMAAQTALVRQADARVIAAQAGIDQAHAGISVIDADIDLTREKIRKSSLTAPGPARVTKLWLKQNEQYQQSLQGMPAISLATVGIKVQTDISELDIPKVREHSDMLVSMMFDAFPDRTYTGGIVSIEPKEVVKEGDTYYRVNFSLDNATEDLRRGMSADVTIDIAQKTGVLKIPSYAVTEREGKTYVLVLDQGEEREVEIKTGLSDGDFVEVTEGLQEGQIVVVPTT